MRGVPGGTLEPVGLRLDILHALPQLGLPVYKLLEGRMRDRIRLYCDSQTESPDDPEAPKKIQSIKDLGFTAAKIDKMEKVGERGVRFLLARVKGPVRDVLDRAGWYQRRGGNIEYPNIASALKAVGSLRPLRGSVPEENLDE